MLYKIYQPTVRERRKGMALIVPFRGYCYDPQKVGGLKQVVAPPYDVISPDAQESLYRRSPFNIIRLILNKERPEDTPEDNRYTRSAAHYQAWRKEGVLLRDSQPHFYFLREEFDLPGSRREAGGAPARRVRRGFIGLIRLEPFGAGEVLPHEKTQSKPKADRLALMEACRANFSQIYGLYTDPEGRMAPVYSAIFCSPAGAAFDFQDDEGVRHNFWKVNDAPLLRRITEIMRTKKIFIADGHHRYETAWAYLERAAARSPRNTGREPFQFTMMYLAAMEDEGVVILPTHRVVAELKEFRPARLMEQLGLDFTIESFAFSDKNEGLVREQFLRELYARGASGRSLGMLLAGTGQYLLLSLRREQAMEEAAPSLAPALKELDVNLLHILILQKRLGIGPEDLAAGRHVLYFQDAGDATRAVLSGKGQVAFFLNPTRAYQVRDVSLAGQTMPSKSTFFYPKLLSGLVINPLDGDEEIPVE